MVCLIYGRPLGGLRPVDFGQAFVTLSHEFIFFNGGFTWSDLSQRSFAAFLLRFCERSVPTPPSMQNLYNKVFQNKFLQTYMTNFFTKSYYTKKNIICIKLLNQIYFAPFVFSFLLFFCRLMIKIFLKNFSRKIFDERKKKTLIRKVWNRKF